MKHIPKLALIPAKKESMRCPGKNTRLFAGKPLFLYSVFYALNEGFTPILSTDSEEIINICKAEGIDFIREIVDDSKMENCVEQALSQYSCDSFAILQPTSPFRKAGLLSTMWNDLDTGKTQSGYTAQKIKLIGHLDNQFQRAWREQDAKRFLYFFDGNIIVITPEHYREIGSFFDDDSKPYIQGLPCGLQIDTEEEFGLMSSLAAVPRYKELLPARPGKEKICIVSNKTDLKRDYSGFVHSCDKVIRISKMDNLDSGLTGTRTDIAVVSCFYEYLAYSPQRRHMDALRETPEIYFNNEELACSNEFATKENLSNWRFLPGDVHRSTPRFTTLSKALCLADYLFPDAQLYYLGDIDTAVRAPGNPKHDPDVENKYIRSLIGAGRLIPILEDDLPEHRYSTEMTAQANDAPSIPEPPEGELQTVTIIHPKWKDRFRFGKSRGWRMQGGDCAEILMNDRDKLTLKWDNWGTETYRKVDDETCELIETACSDNINQVTKYREELFISIGEDGESAITPMALPFINLVCRHEDFLHMRDTLSQQIEQVVCRMPRLKSVLFAAIGKGSLPALSLAARLRTNQPHLNIGVWG